MKYGDLIQFEPIETVVQLRSADDVSRAEQLVASYVISDDMAERLTSVVFPNLQFEQPADNKGLLIVGNYGTGKSHLMAVLSAIAEHARLVSRLRAQSVADAAQVIAGKFKVIRTELGSTTMDFRDFICAELEEQLGRMGVTYEFPPRDKIPNHKAAFEEMMRLFHEKYPDKGLLLVVDELLDYLRSRADHELMLDLSFLREVGEICQNLRFRFIAGIQEALFDNPRFSFVANTLLKVKDRFEQVFIARRDIKFVVAERLLKKTAEQQVKIREHLSQFTRFYGNMNERLDEFVRLFPIHPDYIDMFERVRYVEKRAILKTLSLAMKQMLDAEIPPDAPGLISYDHYWMVLKEDRSYRVNPEIRDVIECSSRLEGLVETGYPKGKNKEFARRIIHGLSLHRLTVGDIEKPVGLTAEALRDTLCLFDPLVRELGGEPADDLRGEVETALRLIVQTVNGQFISATEQDAKGRPGGQFYLDIKKTVDYETLINKRAESLDKQRFDYAYFNALAQALERSDTYYPGTHLAWEYEIEWQERRATRLGYMFFGTPNERSTAQPPRDFYLFFLQLYNPPPFKDEKRPGDVFFRLSRPDDVFEAHLRRYAGSLDLAQVSSGKDKSIYETKASQALRELVKWLKENIMTAFDVTYQGKTRVLGEWIKIREGKEIDVREVVNLVASTCLAAHFEDLAPEYPEFSVLTTSKNLAQAAQDALRSMRGHQQTKQGLAILQALELLQNGRLNPRDSRYAKYILELLRAKGQGKVLDRNELMQEAYGLEYMAPDRYRLEPELVVVLLAALVYSGDIVVVLPGNRKFDAGSFEELINLPVQDLLRFKHLEHPKEWNLPALETLFELLGLPPGMARLVTEGNDEPVQQMQAAVEQTLQRVVVARERLEDGMYLWDQSLCSEGERETYANQLDDLKEFLESLQVYSSAGRLKNLRHDTQDIQAQKANLDALSKIEAMLNLVGEIRSDTSYLAAAERLLPRDHPWVARMAALRTEILTQVSQACHAIVASTKHEIRQKLLTLKNDYIQTYMTMHTRARLGQADDKRKARLLQDDRLNTLKKLATIDLMPTHQLTDFQERVARIKSCFVLTAQDLTRNPMCPHCQFDPSRDSVPVPASNVLEALEDELDRVLQEWTRCLLDNLEDPTIRQNLDLLKPEARGMIEGFLQGRSLPPDPGSDFVQALREVLAGLTKVVLKSGDLKAALTAGGSPATLDEIRKRFDDYLGALVGGRDPSTVRIVVE